MKMNQQYKFKVEESKEPQESDSSEDAQESDSSEDAQESDSSEDAQESDSSEENPIQQMITVAPHM